MEAKVRGSPQAAAPGEGRARGNRLSGRPLALPFPPLRPRPHSLPRPPPKGTRARRPRSRSPRRKRRRRRKGRRRRRLLTDGPGRGSLNLLSTLWSPSGREVGHRPRPAHPPSRAGPAPCRAAAPSTSCLHRAHHGLLFPEQRPVQLDIWAPRPGGSGGWGLGIGAAPVSPRAGGGAAAAARSSSWGRGPGRPHRTRWKVSQYMSKGCAAATAMVRYMRSWFRAPRTGTPSAAASARIFSRSVRIWGGRGCTLESRAGRGCLDVLPSPASLPPPGRLGSSLSARGEPRFPPHLL